jgi:hypothetical protein
MLLFGTGLTLEHGFYRNPCAAGAMGIHRRKNNGRSVHEALGEYFALPLSIVCHDNWTQLSANGCKLVVDMGKQFNGRNNGYLSASWEKMSLYGWKSRETLAIAIAEAQHYGLVERTRQGGYKRPNFYALTWWRIHPDPDGKHGPLDCQPTARPSGLWKEKRDKFQQPDWVRQKRQRDRQRGRSTEEETAISVTR